MAKTKIPDDLRQTVFKRDNYTCRYCGASGPEVQLHADHVYPESKGGETTIDNLVTACKKCNIKKQAKVGVWPTTHFIVPKGKPAPIWMHYAFIAMFASTVFSPELLHFNPILAFFVFVLSLAFTISILAFYAGWIEANR